MSSEYNQYWYWENMVLNEAPLWSDSFKNLNLTRESIFIYSTIMCRDRGILKSNWAYYPNVESLLGFIEHVFMPTAFFTWLDNSTDFKVPVATVAEVLDVMSKEENVDHKEIDNMWEFTNKVQKLWELDYSCDIDRLKDFSELFNNKWKINDDKILSFKLFESTKDIASFVFEDENDECFEEVIEEDIGMSRSDWIDMCSNVYDSKFLSKKFIDILSNRLGYLF